MSPKIKWYTADNSTGTATCKQHIYIPHRVRPYCSDHYDGNKKFCGKGYLSDGDKAINWKKIEGEPPSENRCKHCIKKLEKLQALDHKEEQK